MISRNDGFAITKSHTILHQKLLIQPRKSGVTVPQVTAKNDPSEASRRRSTLHQGKRFPFFSVQSLRRRAEVVITYPSSTLLTCETHVYPRVEKFIVCLALRLY